MFLVQNDFKTAFLTVYDGTEQYASLPRDSIVLAPSTNSEIIQIQFLLTSLLVIYMECQMSITIEDIGRVIDGKFVTLAVVFSFTCYTHTFPTVHIKYIVSHSEND